MKKLKFRFYKLLPLAILLFVISCDGLEDPTVCYTVSYVDEGGGEIEVESPITITSGTTLFFNNCGGIDAADHYAGFSGLPGHVYDSILSPTDTTTTGISANSAGDFTIPYPTTGTFTATLLLTNRDRKDPYKVKQKRIDYTISVVDSL